MFTGIFIPPQKSLRLRESKFGRALVLETFAKAGGYILGFRVDPQERIADVFQEIQSLYQVYSVGPIFGVDFAVEAEAPEMEALLQSKVVEDADSLLDDQLDDSHAIAAYYSDSAAGGGGDGSASRFDSVQVDAQLGLAVEGLVDGITTEQLWRVI